MTAKCCPTCGQPVPEFGGIVLDDAHGEVRCNGKAVHLTQKQTGVLRVLLDAAGRPVSKESFMDALYWLHSSAEEPDWKVISIFICGLRKKVQPIGIRIETQWGFGYYLAEPEKMEGKAA